MPESLLAQQSLLQWMIQSLGMVYVVLLPLAGIVCFAMTLTIVFRGKGPMASVSLILIVHIPLLIGLFAAFQGAMSSFTVIAMSPSAPKPSEVAQGYATALVAPLVGMFMMVPCYLTAVIGSFLRAIQKQSE